MRQIKNPLLHRSWIDLEAAAGEAPLHRWPLGLGAGITAYDFDDALDPATALPRAAVVALAGD